MQLEKLALKIAKRDKKSFEELYGALSRIVYSVCLGIVRNPSVAEELTQDTFVSVWENIGSYSGKGFKTWIITIARNKSLNALRSGRREVAVDFAQNENIGGDYSMEDRIDMRSALEVALNNLQDDERKIVLMRNSGLRAKEIATILGIPRGTVSWKYSQALERMKKILEKEK